MKKTLIVTLLTVLISSSGLLPVAALSERNSVALVVSDERGFPGDEVWVSFTVMHNPGLASLKFSVVFDCEVLTLTSVRFEKQFGLYSTAPEPYESPQVISMICPLKETKANGLFVTLVFQISETAAAGRTAITAVFDEEDVCDGALENVSLNVTDGSVTVENDLPGDANGDGIVNLHDVYNIMRYLVGYKIISFRTKSADLNKDGKVNALIM